MPHTLNKDIFTTSYFVLHDKIAAANPGMSDHDLRLKTAQQFRPRYAQDIQTFHHESEGTKEYTVQEIELTPDGDIRYPKYGTTSEELNENTRLYYPTEYSVSDHQASRLAARTLAKGASFVAVSYAREGNDNRDIQVFMLDPVTKRGHIMMINTAPYGNLHSFSEMQVVMKNLFPKLTEVHSGEKISLLADKVLSTETTAQVIGSVVREKFNKTNMMEVHHETQPNPSESVRTTRIELYARRDDLNTGIRITRNIIRDTLDTVGQVYVSLRDQYPSRRISNDTLMKPSVGKIRKFSEKKLVDDSKQRIELVLKKISVQTPPSERLTIEKIREKPVRIGEVIQRRHQEMRQTTTTLATIADTRVGIGAIPLLIGILAKELPRQVKAVEKSIGRQERRKRRVKHRELRIMGKGKTEKKLHVRNAFSRRRREIMVKQSKKEMKYQKAKERHVRKISEMKRATEIRMLKPKKRKRIQLTESAKHKERMVGVTRKKEREKGPPEGSVQRVDIVLHKTLVRLARKLKKNENVLLYVSEGVKQHRKVEDVARFSFAWVMWILQETSSIYSRNDTSSYNKLEQSALILQKELTLWVLLSIIWYLAMIRESPRAGQKIYSTKRKKKKHAYTSIVPNQAIIFAYGS